jgi:hypothetical protein
MRELIRDQKHDHDASFKRCSVLRIARRQEGILRSDIAIRPALPLAFWAIRLIGTIDLQGASDRTRLVAGDFVGEFYHALVGKVSLKRASSVVIRSDLGRDIALSRNTACL